jgi:hypothetical protein
MLQNMYVIIKKFIKQDSSAISHDYRHNRLFFGLGGARGGQTRLTELAGLSSN